jgi:hypothetical protein
MVLWFLVRRWQRRRALGVLAAIMFAASIPKLFMAGPWSVIIMMFGAGSDDLTMRIWGILAGITPMLVALVPALALLFLRPRYRREVAERVGLCPACGYDLRGTLAAGVRTCPECGTKAPANAVALALG